MKTRYFEEHGGYEYARQFYEEAYRFGSEIYSADVKHGGRLPVHVHFVMDEFANETQL